MVHIAGTPDGVTALLFDAATMHNDIRQQQRRVSSGNWREWKHVSGARGYAAAQHHTGDLLITCLTLTRDPANTPLVHARCRYVDTSTSNSVQSASGFLTTSDAQQLPLTNDGSCVPNWLVLSSTNYAVFASWSVSAVYQCFAADSRVRRGSGVRAALSELRNGDSVWAVDSSGTPVVSRVYYQHTGANDGPASLLRIRTVSGRSVRLSPTHFVPTLVGGCGALFARAAFMTAADVAVGDGLFVEVEDEGDGGAQEGASRNGGSISSVQRGLVCSPVVAIDVAIVRGVRNPQVRAAF